jgi:TaqI-like C-terminal specificity domain/N-6 DNA Methylase
MPLSTREETLPSGLTARVRRAVEFLLSLSSTGSDAERYTAALSTILRIVFLRCAGLPVPQIPVEESVQYQLQELLHFDTLEVEQLGTLYEQMLDHTARRSSGSHYTPRRLTEPLVRSALEPLVHVGAVEGWPRAEWVLRSSAEIVALKVCDIACGGGAFLVAACRYLAGRLQEAARRDQEMPLLELDALRRAVGCLFGVDRDPLAVEVTRMSLRLLTGFANHAFDDAIRCGDALLDDISPPSGFDAVIGNPPWGQKGIDASPAYRGLIQRLYPSAIGIFDLFRPFVERAVRLTRPGGALGLVLPDIVLLKNYPQTRKFLLDQVRLRHLSWHSLPFPGATIDAVTLDGVVGLPPFATPITVRRFGETGCVETQVPQADFDIAPGYEFNLHLTAERKASLVALAEFPCLGDFFEIHEGVHSGNIRAELFLDRWLDASCRELYVGRAEIRPHRLSWAGRFVHLNAVPARRSGQRYANVGKPQWYAAPKVLVRRTGDFVLAAVDDRGRYASNNFFVVIPAQKCSLDVFGLAALLNSRLLTWYYRGVVPRQGRVFAELKIRHLRNFPLPFEVLLDHGCQELNQLGRGRASAEGEEALALDTMIERAVDARFGVEGWSTDGEPRLGIVATSVDHYHHLG